MIATKLEAKKVQTVLGMAGNMPSPCISVCRMDEASGLCEGCLRTIEEIATWSRLDDAGRRLVLQRLSPRRVAWRALQAAKPAVSDGEEPA